MKLSPRTTFGRRSLSALVLVLLPLFPAAAQERVQPRAEALGNAAPATLPAAPNVIAPGRVMDALAQPNAPRDAQGALALAALDRKIADLDSEEADSKKELAELGGKISQARSRARARGRAFYKLSRVGSLPLGGGFEAFVDHAMRVERARRVLGTDIENERKVREHGADIARTLERVGHERVFLAGQRSSMDAARVAVEDETRRQQAFDRAFTDSNGAGEFVAIYGGAGAGENAAGGFAAARGRLLFPVAGRAEARVTKREGTDGPGAEIRTQAGALVRAVYNGRIAFADRYGPYGRLVIVDHGDHYYSVSGNLASMLVKVGDEVSAGDKLGTVGDEGKGAMLYFEVRHRTETLNPGPWIGLQEH